MDCKNCKENLKDKDGFCSGCGARVIDERITFKFLLKEILNKVLSVDNKLLKTFLHLFSKPHKVIDNYIVGVRKRYFNPFSYLLISITLAGISFYLLKDYALQAVANNTTGSTTGNPFLENKDLQRDIVSYVFDYQSFITALIIPIYGAISWLVFLNKRKYNYFEHIVIYLYATAQITILNFIITTPLFFIHHGASNTASLIISCFSLMYNAYVLIRIFKLNVLQFIVKFFYFILLSIVTYIICSIIALLGIFVFLGPDYFNKFKPVQKKNSIQKVQPKKIIKANDSLLKNKKTGYYYYEASSTLNCLS